MVSLAAGSGLAAIMFNNIVGYAAREMDEGFAWLEGQ
jgi:hypothetical protein